MFFKVDIVLVLRFCLTFYAIFLLTSVVCGQAVELNKKEIDTRLTEIQQKIDGKEYESAMELFNSKTQVISEDNVGKKSLEAYQQIKAFLKEKENLFTKTKAQVEEYEQLYRDQEYCEALGLLGLQLTKENAFEETIDRVSFRKPKYLAVKEKCESYKRDIQRWKKEYNAQNYEWLYSRIDISSSDQNYLFKEDKAEYIKLTQLLYDKRVKYGMVKKRLIEIPKALIKNIDYDALNYEQCKEMKDQLSRILGREAELEELEGHNPEIRQEYNVITKLIKSQIHKLKEYQDALAPMTLPEITSAVVSAQHVSRVFIENKCKKIENLGGSSFQDNKLFYLYNQDVFNYFHADLGSVRSPDQKETYKLSDDYRQKQRVLAKLKEDFDETVFYIEVHDPFRQAQYDEQTQSFKIIISSDIGNNMGEARPAKCLNRINLSELPFVTESNSYGGKDHKLLIPIPIQKARELQQSAQSISLYFLFKIKYSALKVYKFSDFQGETKVIQDPVFAPSFLRVIAAGKDGPNHYDEYFELTGTEDLLAIETSGNDNNYRGVVNTTSAAQNIKIGAYYALIIGADHYRGVWTPLKNAVNDAKAVQQTLEQYFHFDYFKTLYNEQATRANIIKAMEWLVSKVQENDNVLIYYSGHGEFNKALNKGYWVPIDAQTNSVSDFISNSVIQDFLKAINSRHTLLLADACFSGDIFRGSVNTNVDPSTDKYYKKIYELKSRQAISSGGIEPVMDGGRDGHSVFTYYLLEALKNNSNHYMDAEQLYSKIKIPIVNNSSQSPILSPIKDTGDEGGQFIFIRR